ncbi:MAG: DUF1896 family protein [Ferruginibacter sp.]
MEKELMKRLHNYISENYPDLLLELQERCNVTEYLVDKIGISEAFQKQMELIGPVFIIEEECMDIIISEFKPSKYNYINNILEEEFENEYLLLKGSGILKFETINMINYCETLFEEFDFNDENESNRFLRYRITGCISEYFESNKVGMKNARNELQQPSKITG